ncbi:MAG: hypothetical protein PUD59_03230 [bacterium]|nr:hypothetical protein [bacterium]
MAVIDIRDESLSKEKGELEALRKTIEQRIASIDSQLTTLKECWQDEKSEKWLSEQNNLMSELKTQNENTITQTDLYFDEIIKILKVYTE